MNCPGGILVYKRRHVDCYRDLPMRMGELGLVHRHELSGALHGLMRVRCFTQDDAHIFMTPEQIKDEIKGVVRPDRRGLLAVRLHVSRRTVHPPGELHGHATRMWEHGHRRACSGALDELGVDYVVNEGDGAFYGPKIDFHLEDCHRPHLAVRHHPAGLRTCPSAST